MPKWDKENNKYTEFEFEDVRKIGAALAKGDGIRISKMLKISTSTISIEFRTFRPNGQYDENIINAAITLLKGRLKDLKSIGITA